MFLEHLFFALRNPRGQLFVRDDELPFDADRYRAILSAETWSKEQTGELDTATAAWVFRCIADGWVDAHLSDIRDALLELLAVRNTDHLHDLLCRATLNIVGSGGKKRPDAPVENPLSETDVQLLQTVAHAVTDQPTPLLGGRLFARRYAQQVGLFSHTVGGCKRSALGDAVLELPTLYVWPFLLGVEMFQTMGQTDRWRVPQETLAALLERVSVPVRTTFLDGNQDTQLFLWPLVRRLHRQGLVEPLTLEPPPSEAAQGIFYFRLTSIGVEALERVLRTPEHQAVHLGRMLLQQQTQAWTRAWTDQIALGAPHPDQRLTEIEHTVPPRPNPEQLDPVLARITDFEQPPGPTASEPKNADPPSGPPILAKPTVLTARDDLGVELAALIRAAWTELQEKHVHFTLIGPATRILGDRRVLLRIMREVLRSSALSARQGHGSLALVSVAISAHDNQVVVLVHDNGIGPALTSRPTQALHTSETEAVVIEPRADRLNFLQIQSYVQALGGDIVAVAPRLGGTSLQIVFPAGPASLQANSRDELDHPADDLLLEMDGGVRYAHG